MRITRFQVLIRFWESEWSLSALLFLLVLATFIVMPALELGARSWLLDASFSLVLITGVWAVSRHRAMTVAVAVVVFIGLALHWVPYAMRGAAFAGGDALASLIAFALMGGIVTAKVFRKGPITLYRIQGAVVVYLLLGLAWSRAYILIEMFSPGAFQFASHAGGLLSWKLTYYSFITLTSVGYGDITPSHPFARSLSAMEALVGQLFPAILIARLVAMEMAQSKRFKSVV